VAIESINHKNGTKNNQKKRPNGIQNNDNVAHKKYNKPLRNKE